MSALSARKELARKAIHLLAAVFPVAYAAGVTRRQLTIVLGVLALIALVVELTRIRHERARQMFARFAGPLLRVDEWDRLSGATWLVVALLVAVVLLPRDVAIAAMWAAAVGDAAAAVVGRAFGSRRFGVAGKSPEGGLACFLTAVIGGYAVAHLPLAESIVCGLAAAAGEFPTRPLDDNVRIVAAVGSAILLWRIAFS